MRDALLAQLRAHDTIILVGETGSGKSTLVPGFVLDAGLAAGRRVAVTQPRRVAAVTIATRVADERGGRVGEEVGYRVRFDDATEAGVTKMVYCTDGMLLRDALVDPLLSRYGAILLDEAHERTVATDVLLGLVKRAQAARRVKQDGKKPSAPPLRVIVMSATLDAAKFASYFGGARVVHVEGRAFPVDVFYTAVPQPSYVDAAVSAAVQAHADEAPGDILVFLTGADEIEAVARLLRDRIAKVAGPPGAARAAVVPLYASLAPAAQAAAFDRPPPNTRKIVLATNVAETSVTLPGVRFVIDAGLVKARTYAPAAGADALAVVPVSQAQAAQRAGRAGREAPGKCFRLYTEASFRELARSAPPELQRANLAAVVLQLAAVGVTDVLGFDFVDPPPRASLLRAVELLLALGALDAATGALTPRGAALARLPVDPPHARVLLAAVETCCGDDAAAVVAMAASDAVFVDGPSARDAAAERRRRFASPLGDAVTLLRVFRGFQEVSGRRMVEVGGLVGCLESGARRVFGGVMCCAYTASELILHSFPPQPTTHQTPPSAHKAWCSDFYLSHRALRKAVDIHAQLMEHVKALTPRGGGGAPPSPSDTADLVPLRRALAAGLFAHAALRGVDGRYTVVATGRRVALHPSSVLVSGGLPRAARGAPSTPACIVFDECLRTARDYARGVTVIEAAWLPELAPGFFEAHRGTGLGAAAR